MTETREPEEMTRSCPDCGRANPFSHRFCEECGGSLRSSERSEEAPRSRRRRRAADPDQVARAHARQEFGRAKRIVFYLRSIYAVGILLGIVEFLQIWVADGRGLLPEGFETLLYLVAGMEFSVMLAGTLLVMRSPLVWSVVIAAWWSIAVAIGMWLRGVDTIGTSINVFFLLAFWAGVMQAARVQRLMAENPDLQLVRKRISRDRHVEGGVLDTARARRKGGRGGVLRMVGLLAGAIVVAVLAIWLVTRPPGPDAKVEAFSASLKVGDTKAMDAMFAGDGVAGRFQREIQRRGWDAQPPVFEGPRVEERADGKAVAATFRLSDGGEVTAHLSLDENRSDWFVTYVELPTVRAPELDGFVERFRRAWAASGTDALLDTLTEGLRLTRGQSISRLLERRGWDQERPELGRHAVSRNQDGRARVEFETAEGDLRLTVEFWHPRWEVSGMRFPRDG